MHGHRSRAASAWEGWCWITHRWPSGEKTVMALS